MYELKFTKEKKVLKQNDEGAWEEIDANKIFPYIYMNSVSEWDGWTVRDIMEFIKPLGTIFGELAWCDFDIFYKEMNKPSKKSKFVDEIDYMRIAWTAEIFGDEEYTTEGLDFVGISKFTDEEIEESSRSGEYNKSRRYSVSLSPINEFADKEIKLDETYEIIKDFNTVLFKTKKVFNLMDVIFAILWEISWHGDPEEKEDFRTKLNKLSDDIKSGKEKTMPYKEVFDKLKEKIKDKP